MLVRTHMSAPPIVIRPETSLSDALRTMQAERIRRLPVVDGAGKLVGIVSDKDLLHAQPSPVTSLSIWEITYLLGRLTVREAMTAPVLTVGPDDPIESAAQLMVERKIGGLPVVDGDRIVGVITETDIFKVFSELFGAGEPGVRVTVRLGDEPGALADLARGIADAGGNLTAVASYPDPDPASRQLFVKVVGLSAARLADLLGPLVVETLEVGEAPGRTAST